MESPGIVGLRLKVDGCFVQSQPIWPERKGGAEDGEQGDEPKHCRSSGTCAWYTANFLPASFLPVRPFACTPAVDLHAGVLKRHTIEVLHGVGRHRGLKA